MKSFGTTILRVGMASVIIWFGVQQIIDPKAWIGFLPDWLTGNAIVHSYVSARGIVMLNGWFEIFFGSLLFIGFLTRLSALLLGAHLFGIAYSIGYDSIGMRDVGLAVATISMMVSGGGKWAFDSLFESASVSTVPQAPGLSSTMSPAMQGGGKAIGAMSYTPPAAASASSSKLAPMSGSMFSATSNNPMAAPTVSAATGTAAHPNTEKAVPFVAPVIKDFIIGGNNSSIPPIPAPSMPSAPTSAASSVSAMASSVTSAPAASMATPSVTPTATMTASLTTAAPAMPASMPAMPSSMPSTSGSAAVSTTMPTSSTMPASAPSNLPVQNMADILLNPKDMQPNTASSASATSSAPATSTSSSAAPQVLSVSDLSAPVDLNAPASATAPSTTPDAVISPTSTTSNNLGQLGPLG